MCILLQDSSAQELFVFHTLQPKHMDITLFPLLLHQPGILCLMKLDTFSQLLQLKLLQRTICLKPTTASKFFSSTPPPPPPPATTCFLNYCSWLMWCVYTHLCKHVHMCVCGWVGVYVCNVAQVLPFNFLWSEMLIVTVFVILHLWCLSKCSLYLYFV